jgi:hypothetical protein
MQISSLYLGPGAKGVCLYVNCNTKSLLDPEKTLFVQYLVPIH